jgi:hypothetical protein
MANTSEQVQLLIDRLEIDDLLTRYTVALDTREWDLLATVFTPDATIDYTSSPHRVLRLAAPARQSPD